MIRFVSAVWAFHLSWCAAMQRHNNSFHCRYISFFAYRAFVVSRIVLNSYSYKASGENYRSSKCIFKLKTSRLSSYLIHWNIFDASLGMSMATHGASAIPISQLIIWVCSASANLSVTLYGVLLLLHLYGSLTSLLGCPTILFKLLRPYGWLWCPFLFPC